MAEPRVCFDQQIFTLQRAGGISRYFIRLAASLQELGCSAHIVAPYHHNELLREAMASNPAIGGSTPLSALFGRSRRTRTGYLKLATRLSAYNGILHETYYTDRIRVSVPKVTTVHDMTYELFNQNTEEQLRVIRAKKQALFDADAIIAVSENTRRDLIGIYPAVKSKVSVVHHGVTPSEVADGFVHEKPYILFVGNRGWYKNFDALLEVYGSHNDINHTYDLICFGGEDPQESERATIDKHGVAGKVHFMRGSDALLNSLYRSASVLAYVSRYEGFGMPVLEAMQQGCPVVCDRGSALPEVAGEAAVFVDAQSRESISWGLEAVLFDAIESERLRMAGYKQAAKFTWEACATKTMDVYRSLLNR